ncbi:MAG: iron(III) transport system substrate-binding protein, partial [Zhongshania sp.]
QWGSFRADSVPISEAGRLQSDAIKLMDRAGYR